MTTPEAIRELHNEQVRLFRSLSYPGTKCIKYAREIRTFIAQHKIHTLLDYGCGVGDQYNDNHKFDKLIGLPKSDIDLYDIGVRAHDKLPNNIYDCVLAVDVFHYIPEELFEYEFNRIYSRARTVFAVVNLSPIDDNAPTIAKPIKWWDEVFCSFPHLTHVIYHGSRMKESGVKVYHGGTHTG